jgi:hypothetical protein
VWRLTQYSQFALVIHNQSLVHSVLQLRNNKQWSSYLALSRGTPNRYRISSGAPLTRSRTVDDLYGPAFSVRTQISSIVMYHRVSLVPGQEDT